MAEIVFRGKILPQKMSFLAILGHEYIPISSFTMCNIYNMKEGRGSGGLPSETEAFSEFLDVR